MEIHSWRERDNNKKFSATKTEWHAFWEQFNSFHNFHCISYKILNSIKGNPNFLISSILSGYLLQEIPTIKTTIAINRGTTNINSRVKTETNLMIMLWRAKIKINRNSLKALLRPLLQKEYSMEAFTRTYFPYCSGPKKGCQAREQTHVITTWCAQTPSTWLARSHHQHGEPSPWICGHQPLDWIVLGQA